MALLYDLSFSFFVLLTALSVLASGASLIFQAIFSATAAIENWNVISIVGSYVALAVISSGIYISRKITTVRNLRGIPKSYVAIKDGDVPESVASLISTEYDRVCAIAHISQPNVVSQEGWGTPGTKLEGVQFRRAMLDTLLDVDADARSLIPSFPSLKPHQSIAQHFKPLEPLISLRDPSCLRCYGDLIQTARYSLREPSQQDYELCIRLSSYLSEIFQFLRSEGSEFPPRHPPVWPASENVSFETAPSKNTRNSISHFEL